MDEKQARKISRKVKRCEEILFKHQNIKASKQPTNSIYIGNGGFGCGLSREIVVEIFGACGSLKNVVMLPDKPYSFVIFQDTGDAVKVMNSMNGKKLESGYIFYMSYIGSDNVPHVVMDEYPLPNGLVLLENFVSDEGEKQLLNAINFGDIIGEKAVLKHRKVKHFGYEFMYESNNVDKERPLEEKIPEVCIPYLQKLVALGYISRIPDQLTVNHYLPGQGIPSHTDTHSAFEDGIISISLGSQVVMDFDCPGKQSVPILLPNRSILILAGDSRYLWRHGITPRKNDIIPSGVGLTLCPRFPRTSFTFRLIRKGECNCEFKDQCDSQQKFNSPLHDIVTNQGAKELEKKYVNQVYEKIADHFSATRYKPWPRVASFLTNVPLGSFILDVGCGNGKNLKLSYECFEVGCDASSNLIRLCSKRGVETVIVDCLRLPFRDNCVDVVICIAVIHHMSTEARRADAVKEIARVLRPGGRSLIYVWAFEQKGQNYLKQTKMPSCNKESGIQFTKVQLISNSNILKLPLHENRTDFLEQDILVPWKDKCDTNTQIVHHRYYHVFAQGELEKLVLQSGVSVMSSYYDKGNWCVVCEK